MFVQRDSNGTIVSAFAMKQSVLYQEFLPFDNEELLAFLERDVKPVMTAECV